MITFIVIDKKIYVVFKIKIHKIMKTKKFKVNERISSKAYINSMETYKDL